MKKTKNKMNEMPGFEDLTLKQYFSLKCSLNSFRNQRAINFVKPSTKTNK